MVNRLHVLNNIGKVSGGNAIQQQTCCHDDISKILCIRYFILLCIIHQGMAGTFAVIPKQLRNEHFGQLSEVPILDA